MLRVFMRVPGVDRIDFRGVHNQRTPVESHAHHPTCAYVSDSAETDTLGSDALGMTAPIQAGMHLGEGTGAVTAYSLYQYALALYKGLPSFAEGKVEKYTHQK